jgi:hypothetical protein
VYRDNAPAEKGECWVGVEIGDGRVSSFYWVECYFGSEKAGNEIDKEKVGVIS